MAKTSPGATSTAAGEQHLHRAVGLRGLTMISLGTMIGSGWLLGALTAAKVAGGASLISWIIGAAVLAVIALVHAELGSTYPVSGGTARFPFLTFGALGGFTGGWMAWLYNVTIPPIETEASLSYLDSHFTGRRSCCTAGRTRSAACRTSAPTPPWPPRRAWAGWLTTLLLIDAVISPAGAGLVYLGTSSRLSYALGRNGYFPPAISKISKRGVPFTSIIICFVAGILVFLPFPSWGGLVELATSAMVFMYALAPLALGGLRREDPDRHRPYRLPAAVVLSPLAFIFANLLVYFAGFSLVIYYWAVHSTLPQARVHAAVEQVETEASIELEKSLV